MRAALVAGWLALATAPLLGCAGAPLEDRPCGCDTAAGYTCCTALNVCLGPNEVCVDPMSWPPIPGVPDGPAPVAMDDLTVFAFSQVGTNGDDPDGQDDQVALVQPQVVIRGWGQWDRHGIAAGDFTTSFLEDCHRNKILFMGGGTATALFADQVSDEAFKHYVTRDIKGNPVPHSDLNQNEFRGSLANADYRKLVIDYGKLQIDAGVDGLQFSEVNADYQGTTINGQSDDNEGFDDAHLADFNAFLLARYGDVDYRTVLDMPADNFLQASVPPGNLDKNFNYARYLREKGRFQFPLMHEDKLSAEWGTTTPGSPAFNSRTFVDTAVPYRYWREIADTLRSYAGLKHPGKRFLISANGTFPFVDFVSAGIYNSPGVPQTLFRLEDVTAPGGPSRYHLHGEELKKGRFRDMVNQAALVARGAPVVIYLDGPWQGYHQLVEEQRRDFWRIYAAEAYANGLFFAFLLKAPKSEMTDQWPEYQPPTARGDKTLELFEHLAAFYGGHADLYHGGSLVPATDDAIVVTAGTPSAAPVLMTSIADQPAAGPRPARRIVHIVNHEYDAGLDPGSGIKSQQNITLTIPVTMPVTKVTIASPDFEGPDLPVTLVPGDGTITVTLPTLDAYDIVIVEY